MKKLISIMLLVCFTISPLSAFAEEEIVLTEVIAETDESASASTPRISRT